jgi:hypothetical protein
MSFDDLFRKDRLNKTLPFRHAQDENVLSEIRDRAVVAGWKGLRK